MSLELFHGISKKIPSLVPGLSAPSRKRCLCSLDRPVETIFLGLGHACKLFSGHRIGDLYRLQRVDPFAVHYIRNPAVRRAFFSACSRLGWVIDGEAPFDFIQRSFHQAVYEGASSCVANPEVPDKL